MKVETVTKLACDFCGRHQDDLQLLIAGHNSVAICDECVDVCVEVVTKERAKKAAASLQFPDITQDAGV